MKNARETTPVEGEGGGTGMSFENEARRENREVELEMLLRQWKIRAATTMTIMMMDDVMRAEGERQMDEEERED
jgi:hypothetical protein